VLQVNNTAIIATSNISQFSTPLLHVNNHTTSSTRLLI